jgi:hypothetical protein
MAIADATSARHASRLRGFAFSSIAMLENANAPGQKRGDAGRSSVFATWELYAIPGLARWHNRPIANSARLDLRQRERLSLG